MTISPENTNASVLTNTFDLKAGLHPLTVLTLLNSTLTVLQEQLENKIQQAPKFFENAPIVIDLGKLQTQADRIDFVAIRAILTKNQLIPVGVKNGNPQQHATAVAAGFAILQEGVKKPKPPAATSHQTGHQTATTAANVATAAKIVTEQVRSGQQVYAKGCDLIVLGSVNQGAELLADGHIHVYGILRGRALAGINGNKNAHIFCRSLEAELVSIAGQFKLSEEIEKIAWRLFVDISLTNGQLAFKRL